ncbi:MAG TPA: glycosyltransferase family 4 protein, partial [Anaerolineae bacterium]|nr:glycosyltransferase family 4 protein [Anaerolineae bacterium]
MGPFESSVDLFGQTPGLPGSCPPRLAGRFRCGMRRSQLGHPFHTDVDPFRIGSGGDKRVPERKGYLRPVVSGQQGAQHMGERRRDSEAGQRMHRVLVLSHMYPSLPFPWSGIFVHQQAQALVRAGCAIRVVAPVPLAPPPVRWLRRKWRAYASIPRRRRWDGIGVRSPRYLTLPRAMLFELAGWTYWLGARKSVSDLVQDLDFDLIHAHTTLPDGFAATLFAHRLGIPLVITVHGYDVQWAVDLRPTVRRVILGTWRRADRVICVSETLRRLCLAHWTGEENKFIAVPNGMALDQLASKDQARGISSRYHGRPLLLTVANVIPQKGHEYVLRALPQVVRHHPDVLYLIVGEGAEVPRLRALARELGMENYVAFCGARPHDEAMAYMAACQVFVMPSWNEAMGIAYLEAMAHGKPIIGCQGEGITDVVTDGETGLLVPPR